MSVDTIAGPARRTKMFTPRPRIAPRGMTGLYSKLELGVTLSPPAARELISLGAWPYARPMRADGRENALPGGA